MEGGKDFGDTDEGADQVDIGGDGGLNESNTPFEPPFKFPPGYRFCPTDDELINHYLIQKILNRPLPYNNINEVNLYDYNPQHLTESFKSSGENEWYFFTPRDKKYRNGSRPNRAAGDGYWKATGADKPVYTNGIVEPIGVRKALVFYKGKPPKGDKTNWIMHEYRLNESTDDRKKYSNSMRLDDWVLCRVYEKPNNDKSTKGPRDEHSDTVNSTRSIEELPYASKINTSDIFEMSMLPTLTTDPMGLNFPNDYSLPTYSSWFSSGYPSHPSDSNLSDLSTSDIFNNHLDNVEFGQVDQYLSVEPNASDTTTHAMMMNKYRPMPRSMNMEEELSMAPQVDMYSRNIMGQYDASGYQDEVKGLNQRKEKQKISTAKHQGVILKRHYTS